MQKKEMGKALSWESPIANDGSIFTLLPEDTECDFEVTELQKTRDNKRNCPCAKVKLSLNSDVGRTTVTENLSLHTDLEWKLAQFFTALGMRKHGESLVPDWNRVPGKRGRCTVSVGDPWTGDDGKVRQSNHVKRFLEPDDVHPSAAEPEPPAAPEPPAEPAAEAKDDIRFD